MQYDMHSICALCVFLHPPYIASVMENRNCLVNDARTHNTVLFNVAIRCNLPDYSRHQQQLPLIFNSLSTSSDSTLYRLRPAPVALWTFIMSVFFLLAPTIQLDYNIIFYLRHPICIQFNYVQQAPHPSWEKHGLSHRCITSVLIGSGIMHSGN